MKNCARCKTDLDESNFCKDRHSRDGLHRICRSCMSKARSEFRINNLESCRERERAFSRSRDRSGYNRKYRSATREHRRFEYENAPYEMKSAWRSVAAALRNGTMVRPNVCVICGVECKPTAHHYDYSKRLDVTWLCRSCHNIADRAKAESRALLPKEKT